jgi:hypothetical protein
VHISANANATVDHTERIGDTEEYERGIDFDAGGHIVGYEFMNASRGLDLDGVPHREEIAAFINSIAGLRVVEKAS